MDTLPPNKRRDVALFEQRFADWLRLRAELAAESLSSTPSMDAVDVKSQALRDTESLLMTMPAPVPWIVWKKFEVLERVIVDEDGPVANRSEVWMLAGIKADLMALGIKWGDE